MGAGALVWEPVVMNGLPDPFPWLEREIAAAVTPLCERYGFGAVMDTTARIWRQRDPGGALTVDDGDARRRIEDALIHYQIGVETEWEMVSHDIVRGGFVDWQYVAQRMAKALESADEQEREGAAAE